MQRFLRRTRPVEVVGAGLHVEAIRLRHTSGIGKQEVAICFQMNEAVGDEKFPISLHKKVEVSRLVSFFIWGSEKVNHISLTSCAAKKRSIIEMSVRRKATFVKPPARDSVAPVHIRAPLISTPIKFFSGWSRANPTAYSPFPQPNSSTRG